LQWEFGVFVQIGRNWASIEVVIGSFIL